jgi:DNA-binding NtrC family response regulator
MHSDMQNARSVRGEFQKTLPRTSEDDLDGASESYRRTVHRIRRFARTDDPVVLQGESGTGKSRLAACLHRLSSRSDRPFYVVNMAELDDNLASSELFGHVCGAFTGADRTRKGAFATAHSGTIFLDEGGKCSLANQGRLLRAMESRTIRPLGSDVDVPVDVRIIFAASEPLEQLVEAGRMLRDFLPRLGAFRIVVPPLRDRRDDIPLLVRRLIECHAPRRGYACEGLPVPTPALMAALVAYDWPDNVRELDSLIRRLLVDANGAPRLDLDLLTDDLGRYRQHPSRRVARGARRPDIENAIKRADGNKTEAARLLGIGRATLNRHITADVKLDREALGLTSED